ncbi:MAG: tRNA pseudouridine(55) synthase TruB [Dehalococcoidia bacterium]
MSRRTDSGLDGILLIDKPPGWTSHDVVAKARRITGQRRIGHTGTLDPMATGLLVLCLGNATRLVEFLTGHDKRYTGEIALGRTTTTDDAEGDTLADYPVPPLTQAAVDEVSSRFCGVILQRPPAYSALKVQGRRAYALARSGAAPELPPRPVTIGSHNLRLLAPDRLSLDLTCSSGTYVRSLARDLGVALGTGAHLTSLRRQATGPFSLDSAVTLEVLETAVRNDTLDDVLLPADEGLLSMQAAILSAEGARALSNGMPWNIPNLPDCDLAAVRIYSDSGSFVGVGSVSSLGRIHASRVLQRDKYPK